jgi:hypothetical protein
MRAGPAYRALAEEFTRRAQSAYRSGDVAAAEALPPELLKRDQQLGFRRPQEIRHLAEALDIQLDLTRTRRQALDRYAAMRATFAYYERRLRPALSKLDALAGTFASIRDRAALDHATVLRAHADVVDLRAAVERVAPPGELASIHQTLLSALTMAKQACARRSQADTTARNQTSLEASSAAAAALLLAERARADLAAGLSPPAP